MVCLLLASDQDSVHKICFNLIHKRVAKTIFLYLEKTGGQTRSRMRTEAGLQLDSDNFGIFECILLHVWVFLIAAER